MNFSNIDELRAYRNTLLEESDKWYLPDSPLSPSFESIEPAIRAYRIQLRNWPAVETDLANATVPVKPV